MFMYFFPSLLRTKRLAFLKPEQGSTEISPAALKGPENAEVTEFTKDSAKRTDLYSKSTDLVQKVQHELEARTKQNRTPEEQARDKKTAEIVEKLNKLLAQALENERALEEGRLNLGREAVGKTAAYVQDMYQKLTGIFKTSSAEGKAIEGEKVIKATVKESAVSGETAGYSYKEEGTKKSPPEANPRKADETNDVPKSNFSEFIKPFKNLDTVLGREAVYAYIQKEALDDVKPYYRADVRAAAAKLAAEREAVIQKETAGLKPEALKAAALLLLQHCHDFFYGKFEKLGVTAADVLKVQEQKPKPAREILAKWDEDAPRTASVVQAKPEASAGGKFVDLHQGPGDDGQPAIIRDKSEFGTGNGASVPKQAPTPQVPNVPGIVGKFVDLGQDDGDQPKVDRSKTEFGATVKETARPLMVKLSGDKVDVASDVAPRIGGLPASEGKVMKEVPKQEVSSPQTTAPADALASAPKPAAALSAPASTPSTAPKPAPISAPAPTSAPESKPATEDENQKYMAYLKAKFSKPGVLGSPDGFDMIDAENILKTAAESNLLKTSKEFIEFYFRNLDTPRGRNHFYGTTELVLNKQTFATEELKKAAAFLRDDVVNRKAEMDPNPQQSATALARSLYNLLNGKISLALQERLKEEKAKESSKVGATGSVTAGVLDAAASGTQLAAASSKGGDSGPVQAPTLASAGPIKAQDVKARLVGVGGNGSAVEATAGKGDRREISQPGADATTEGMLKIQDVPKIPKSLKENVQSALAQFKEVKIGEMLTFVDSNAPKDASDKSKYQWHAWKRLNKEANPPFVSNLFKDPEGTIWDVTLDNDGKTMVRMEPDKYSPAPPYVFKEAKDYMATNSKGVEIQGKQNKMKLFVDSKGFHWAVSGVLKDRKDPYDYESFNVDRNK